MDSSFENLDASQEPVPESFALEMDSKDENFSDLIHELKQIRSELVQNRNELRNELTQNRNELIQTRNELRNELIQNRIEVLQVKREVQRIQLSFNSRNDLTTGVFRLPDEILLIILEYANQMDTFHLALTHRHFEIACKMKLFKSLYVYNDSEPEKVINVPKKLYTPFYKKYPVVAFTKLLKLISGSYHRPEYLKQILFDFDKQVTLETLNTLVKGAPQCPSGSSIFALMIPRRGY